MIDYIYIYILLLLLLLSDLGTSTWVIVEALLLAETITQYIYIIKMIVNK